ncbi:unnamed protein product [Penicillium pancosmium]
MFDLKKIYLHTYDGQGIRVVLRPQRNIQTAAESTWIQIRFPFDGELLDWTVQQRLKINSRNVTVRTTSQTVELLGGEVELTERVTVEEGPA